MTAFQLLSLPLVLLLALAPEASAQTAESLPETPAGRQAAALLLTLQDGREEAVRAFVSDHMDGEFQQIAMSEHIAMFRRMAGDLALSPITRVEVPAPERLLVTFAAPGGPLVMELRVQPAEPYRISGLDIRSPGRMGAATEPPPADFGAAGVAAVVDSAASIMAAFYVAPDTGRMIGDLLRQRLAGGAYRGITAPDSLAQALTRDLRALNGDRHLNVRVGGGEPGRRRRMDAPAGGPAQSGGYRTIDRVEVLPGNVGYLVLSAIPGEEAAFDEMTRALRSLEGTAGMIIDLRGSSGGSAQMANFLISHFTEAGALSLAVASRAAGDTTMRRTLAEVPGPRRLDVPLYVLIDGGAGSASEDIPFVLKNLGRAVLVGEPTAGAGRNNRFYPIGPGLAMSVSITRVWDPCTGQEWERVGVQPDIAVPSAEALEAALRDLREHPSHPREMPHRACRMAS